MKNNKRPFEFGGALWLEKAGRRFLDSEGIKLLEKVDEVGSITRAAIAVGISYKTAWDRINQINSQADTPLVKRLTGGQGGGGTKLTQSGKEMISQFRAVQEKHRRFLDRIEGSCGVGDGPATYWERISNKPRNSGMFNAQASGWEGNRSVQPPLWPR